MAASGCRTRSVGPTRGSPRGSRGIRRRARSAALARAPYEAGFDRTGASSTSDWEDLQPEDVHDLASPHVRLGVEAELLLGPEASRRSGSARTSWPAGNPGI